MYYFFAIVPESEFRKGNIEPVYTLYTGKQGTGFKSNLIISRSGSRKTKLLVTSPVGNDVIVRFMSRYRTAYSGEETQIHGRNRKYYPKGALFMFECDRYGRRTGPALYIKDVPDLSVKTNVSGKSIMNNNQQYSLIRALAGEPKMISYAPSGRTIHLSQPKDTDVLNKYGIALQKGEKKLWQRV